MTQHYYQTTPLSETQLIGAQRMAKAQEERILALFRRYPWRKLSPREVEKTLADLHKAHGGPPPIDINSVRRSMTNLTSRKKLVHHKKLRIPSVFVGHSETLWQLNFEAADHAGKLAASETVPG